MVFGGKRRTRRERGGGGIYSYSSDTLEGPRAPAVKLTARHSSLTRVRAAPLEMGCSPGNPERELPSEDSRNLALSLEISRKLQIGEKFCFRIRSCHHEPLQLVLRENACFRQKTLIMRCEKFCFHQMMTSFSSENFTETLETLLLSTARASQLRVATITSHGIRHHARDAHQLAASNRRGPDRA